MVRTLLNEGVNRSWCWRESSVHVLRIRWRGGNQSCWIVRCCREVALSLSICGKDDSWYCWKMRRGKIDDVEEVLGKNTVEPSSTLVNSILLVAVTTNLFSAATPTKPQQGKNKRTSFLASSILFSSAYLSFILATKFLSLFVLSSLLNSTPPFSPPNPYLGSGLLTSSPLSKSLNPGVPLLSHSNSCL